MLMGMTVGKKGDLCEFEKELFQLVASNLAPAQSSNVVPEYIRALTPIAELLVPEAMLLVPAAIELSPEELAL